jgi:hypothetical protein
MTFQSPPPHGRSNSDSSNALTIPYAARPRKRTAHAVSELPLRNGVSTDYVDSVTLAVSENPGMTTMNARKSRVKLDGAVAIAIHTGPSPLMRLPSDVMAGSHALGAPKTMLIAFMGNSSQPICKHRSSEHLGSRQLTSRSEIKARATKSSRLSCVWMAFYGASMRIWYYLPAPMSQEGS